MPVLRIVRGDAAEEEIAALVAAVAAVTAARSGAAAGQPRPPVRNNWNEKSRLLRAAVYPSPGGWRRSALP
ncbi:MAG TPA: acyl-CoA carboxylase epsilon subunit [Trebonia sp.]|nr:acyl-CoA carboxylase epsilon subunit [Trebonia sp.]